MIDEGPRHKRRRSFIRIASRDELIDNNADSDVAINHFDRFKWSDS